MATKSPSTKKNTGGRISTKTPGIEYNKTAYHFPESTIDLLQYIEKVLRKRGVPNNSTQTLMEEALIRMIKASCKENHISIPEDMMPTDDSNLCTKLRILNQANASFLPVAATAFSTPEDKIE